jgi:hypothetical protein
MSIRDGGLTLLSFWAIFYAWFDRLHEYLDQIAIRGLSAKAPHRL